MGRRNGICILLLLLFFLPGALSSYASATPLLHVGKEDHYSLAPYLAYREDPAGKLPVDTVLSGAEAGRFLPVSGPEVNFGYSRSVFWLKATLSGGNEPQRLFLEIAYPPLDRVKVYLVTADGRRQESEAGDLYPFATRPYPHRNLVFPLTLPPGEKATLLIRVESQGSLTVPTSLWKEPAFHYHSRNGYIIHSLYYGILAALFLYNFLLFLSLRERVYLAYVCFVAAMAVGQMSLSGLGNEYLWPGFPAWGNIALPTGFSATGFFGALFARLFLDTARSTPRLDRAIVALAAGFAFSAAAPLFLPYQFAAIFTSLLGVSFSAVAVAAGVICMVKGHPGARFFLLAWTLLLLGVALLGMRNLDWMPTTFVTTYGMQIGSTLEMLLLSFALADRINHMRREKEAAQQRALSISRTAERELAAKTQEWEETFNSISDMVIIMDREHRIIKANNAAAASLKMESGSPALLPCPLPSHESGELSAACPCRETFDAKRPATGEFYEPRSDRYLEVSTSPIVSGKGEVTAAVHITKDITWRKRMEEEMVRTQKLESLAVLAGGIAHDFNNMLTVIMSTVTLAKIYAEANAQAIAKLQEAEREIMHARELTNQLLTFAKGGAPVKKLSSLPELLRDTVDFSLKGTNGESELHIAGDLWPAEIDRVQISQVVSNLVLNAVQAMPRGGTVRVRAENAALDDASGVPVKAGPYVKISVEDSGNGIPSGHLTRIFDPFFTTKPQGTGLGLSTSHSIVTKHNGYIAVRSRAGAGSVFDVYLPASLSPCPQESARACREPGGTGRVLLMDDDEKLLGSVREMLEILGYEVETARSGEEAILLYKRALFLVRPFDAVALDLTVAGGMGGRECLRILQELDPGVNALVMSGYAEDATLADYEQYGFKEAVAKPFTIGELHAALRRTMGGECHDAA